MASTEMRAVLFIEATAPPGGSGLTSTGQLGDVMKESAQAAARSCFGRFELGARSRGDKVENGVHLHRSGGCDSKDN